MFAFCFALPCNYHCRALHKEFDDLSAKAREAEKEVNMLQMKIEEVNNNLYKLNKDMECKHYSTACII